VVGQWGSTADERARAYPCDEVLANPDQVLYRAVSVDAPVSVVFRWLCQLKLAPYSYDLVDNLGRRSPQHLVPGTDHLEVGERVMLFDLATFEIDEHITLSVRRHAVFGDVAISYVVTPSEGGGSRLVAKLVTNPAPGPIGMVLRLLLPIGDLVMMRRQLLNLKSLAEATPRCRAGGHRHVLMMRCRTVGDISS
jgi:hypothetical protein